MDLDTLDKHCTVCNALNFLPMPCPYCKLLFCETHFDAEQHHCKSGRGDRRAITCPMCNKPVVGLPNQSPDVVIDAHIARGECHKPKDVHQCIAPGCKNKILVEYRCEVCKQMVCMSHRFPEQHKCTGPPKSRLFGGHSRNAGSSNNQRRRTHDGKDKYAFRARWYSRSFIYRHSARLHMLTLCCSTLSNSKLAIPGRRLDDVIKGDDLFSIIIILSNFRQLKLRENMSENTEPTYNQPKLCANGCGFYGNPTTNMYCSKCYKALQQRGQQPQQTSSSVAESTNVAQQITAPTSSIPQPQLQEPVSVDSSPSTSVQPDRKRCLVCSKKLGLTGLECKCGMMFCTAHRMPDSHNCTYDFKGEARQKLEKLNPKVVADKVEKF